MPRIISYASFSKTTQHTINYLEYIDRQSPLFSPGGEADVKEAVRQARRDTGNLAWYQILSFPSEELERLQADRNYFKAFLSAHKLEIAKAYNITPGALHCYASFHDKDYHPHLHLVFWSSVPGEGAVRVPKQASKVETKKLRAKALNEKSNVIKSLFANEMFRGDIEQLRVQKGEIRQAMNQQFEQQLQALANGKSTLPVGLVDELQKLGQEISVLPGKAQYGWLPSEIKERVSDLLRQAVLETPELAELYAQSREAYYNIVKDTYVDSKITMAEKMEQWERQFFAPMKGQDARKQNLLIETACKLSSKEKMVESAVDELPEVEPDELAPSNSTEKITELAVDDPQEVKPDELAPASGTEKMVEPAVDELPEAESDELAPSNSAEKITELAVDELPEVEPDNLAPASSKEKISGPVVDEPQEGHYLEWNERYKNACFCFYGTKEVAADQKKAFELFSEEAAAGNVLALHDLGKQYARGLGAPKDEELSAQYYQAALKGFLELKGSAEIEKRKLVSYVEYRIGKIYAQGLGIEKDTTTGAEWFQLAANKGQKYAQYSLGGLTARGDGVEKDLPKAFDLFLSSSKQDVPYATFEVAQAQHNGNGTKKDEVAAQGNYKVALKAFEKLEEHQRDDKLEYRLAWMYQTGSGTPKDLPHAKELYAAAAELENESARLRWAKMVIEEIEPEQEELKTALTWLTEAAKTRSDAQYTLGKLYLEGKSLPKDIDEALRLLLLSANQGNDFAAYQLGKLYLQGEEVPKDVKTALHWLNLSLEKDNQFAQYTLGKMYLTGKEVPKDVNEALQLLLLSANQENDFAAYQLGKLYLLGEEIPKDIETALHWLNLSLEKDNQFAQYTLGKMYLTGKEVPKDVNEALRLLLLSANQGNDFASYQLGKLYLRGEEIPKDIETALHWLNLSLEKNNPFAQYTLGKMYLTGKEVPKDIDEALRLLLLSANQGNDFAAYQLGKLYLQGEEVPKDIKTALHWLNLSLEKDNQFAQYTLGKMYLTGKEVPKDVNEALRLLLLSANQGNDFAAYQLGKLYLLGVDVPRDSNAAFHWLSLSAEKNNQFAQYSLGMLYLRGEIVAKDAPRALQYLESSAKQGNQFAQYSLGKLLLKGDRGVPRDREQGMYWMQKSAQQGNTFATAYLQYQSKSALATTCSMLYQLGRIIEADQRAQQNYTGLRHGRMKRKRRGHEYEQQPGIER